MEASMPFPVTAEAQPNTFAFETQTLIQPSSFREHDARWCFGHPGSEAKPQLNLIGVQAAWVSDADPAARRIAPHRDRA
jgi:hypothetical protein